MFLSSSVNYFRPHVAWSLNWKEMIQRRLWRLCFFHCWLKSFSNLFFLIFISERYNLTLINDVFNNFLICSHLACISKNINLIIWVVFWRKHNFDYLSDEFVPPVEWGHMPLRMWSNTSQMSVCFFFFLFFFFTKHIYVFLINITLHLFAFILEGCGKCHSFALLPYEANANTQYCH